MKYALAYPSLKGGSGVRSSTLLKECCKQQRAEFSTSATAPNNYHLAKHHQQKAAASPLNQYNNMDIDMVRDMAQ